MEIMDSRSETIGDQPFGKNIIDGFNIIDGTRSERADRRFVVLRQGSAKGLLLYTAIRRSFTTVWPSQAVINEK